MILFSIDCSTTHGSIALFEGDQLIQSQAWQEQKARHEGLFEVIGRFMAEQDWLAGVDVFAVGRGPGAYSGLRVSLLGAQALAAPDNKPVISVSSMEALARFTSQTHDIEDITVIGDARRGSVWHGRLRRDQGSLVSMEWRVDPVDDIKKTLDPASTLITPHWDALATLRETITGFTWLTGPHFPDAEQIGRLAMARLAAGMPSEPAIPLYLHPAV